MATDAQETVSNTAIDAQTPVEAGRLGFSNAESVKAMFPASPVINGDLDDVEDIYFNGGKHANDPVTIDGLNGTIKNGYGFAENVDLNYSSAPDMSIKDAGKAGPHPANAYVPNPTSPGGVIGVPNDNPESKGVPPETFKNMNGFGGATGGGPSAIDGAGMPIKPSDSSSKISDSQKNHPRGESNWTQTQKLDSQTPTNANSGR